MFAQTANDKGNLLLGDLSIFAVRPKALGMKIAIRLAREIETALPRSRVVFR